MPDNRQIKDGLGNIFTLRMKDVSPNQDGISLQRSMLYLTLLPVDFAGGGSFQRASRSNAMLAGMAAASPIYAFQWTSTTAVAAIRRVKLWAWSDVTAFTAGMAIFDLMIARAFNAQMAGEATSDLSGNSSKMKTAFGTSQASIAHSLTVPLSGGTFTPDSGPVEMSTAAVSANPSTPFSAAAMRLIDKAQGEMPLLLASHEGFFIRATVPATGTWRFAVTTEWDETAPYMGY
jgi:hypothetical protein